MVHFDFENQTYKINAKGLISYDAFFFFRFIYFYKQNTSWCQYLKSHRIKSSNDRVLPP